MQSVVENKDGKKNPYARAHIINAEAIQEVAGLKMKMVKLLGKCTKCGKRVPGSTPGCNKCQYRVGHQEPKDNNDDDNTDDDNGGDEDRDDDKYDESNNKDNNNNKDKDKNDNDVNTDKDNSDNDVRSNQSETGSVYKATHRERDDQPAEPRQ